MGFGDETMADDGDEDAEGEEIEVAGPEMDEEDDDERAGQGRGGDFVRLQLEGPDDRPRQVAGQAALVDLEDRVAPRAQAQR